MSEVKVVKKEDHIKLINTRRLQIHELNLFMLSEYSAIFDGVCFTAIMTGQSFSFNHAVSLFNKEASKSGMFIKKINLRLEKSNKKIVCTNHLVKFTEEVKEHCEDLNTKCELFLKEFIKVNRM